MECMWFWVAGFEVRTSTTRFLATNSVTSGGYYRMKMTCHIIKYILTISKLLHVVFQC